MDMDKLMGTLKTMLAEMQEKMDANQAKANKTLKEMQEKMDANQAKVDKTLKEMQEKMDVDEATAHADRKAYREDLKEMKDEIKEEMKSTVSAIEEKLETAINSIRPELKDVNNLTQYLCKEVTETQVDLQVVKTSFETRTKGMKNTREEMVACQETMEARLEGKEEPASEEMKPEVAHEEVPKEDAAVMPVRGLRKQRRGQKHAAGRREEPEKLNRGICGPRENLAATCRKVSRRATVAWRRRNILRKFWTRRSCRLRKEVAAARVRITRCSGHRRKGRNKDGVERETHKGPTERNGHWRGPVCENGIRNRGLKLQLRSSKRIKDPTKNDSEGWNPRERAPLGSGGSRKKDICDISREKIMVTTRIGKEVFKRTTRLGIAKRSEGSPVALRMIKKWTQWRGRPPLKRKKEQEAE
jgi:hypothetical protein